MDDVAAISIFNDHVASEKSFWEDGVTSIDNVKAIEAADTWVLRSTL